MNLRLILLWNFQNLAVALYFTNQFLLCRQALLYVWLVAIQTDFAKQDMCSRKGKRFSCFMLSLTQITQTFSRRWSIETIKTLSGILRLIYIHYDGLISQVASQNLYYSALPTYWAIIKLYPPPPPKKKLSLTKFVQKVIYVASTSYIWGESPEIRSKLKTKASNLSNSKLKNLVFLVIYYWNFYQTL